MWIVEIDLLNMDDEYPSGFSCSPLIVCFVVKDRNARFSQLTSRVSLVFLSSLFLFPPPALFPATRRLTLFSFLLLLLFLFALPFTRVDANQALPARGSASNSLLFHFFLSATLVLL